MPESSFFRTPFTSQGINGSQTVLKVARQRAYSNFALTEDKFSWKTLLSVKSQILLECPKASVSEHPSGVKVLTGPKHCWNLHGRTFILIPLI